MGLFSFLKDAGAKVFGGKTSAEKEAENEVARSQELKNKLNSLNLGLEDVEINVVGDKVSISGIADSQAEREKAILTVGNVNGVATVSDNITVESPQPESKFVTVESGDSLSKIAKREYGDPMKYPVIFEANKPMLSDPDKIYPGQVLRIPPLNDMA